MQAVVAHVDSWPGTLGLAEFLLESSQTPDAPRWGNKERFPVNNSTLQPSPKHEQWEPTEQVKRGGKQTSTRVPGGKVLDAEGRMGKVTRRK